MAEAGAAVTGLKELEAMIDRLPETVTASLRLVAATTAHRIRERAQKILRSQTHGTGATANAIVVIPEPEHKRYVVDSLAAEGAPHMLPTWIEFGTRFQPARPYMRPAGDAEDERYKQDSVNAATAVVDRLGTV